MLGLKLNHVKKSATAIKLLDYFENYCCKVTAAFSWV